VVTAFNQARRHLDQTRRIGRSFHTVVDLPRWKEEEIRALILGRQKKSGLGVSFESMVLKDLRSGPDGDANDQLMETQEGYIRLLWNFSEGNPRIAQHFWLRSLVPNGTDQTLQVNLYSAPSADDLEEIDEDGRFLLAAMALHGYLSIEEAAHVLHMPRSVVEVEMDRGLAQGLYRHPVWDPGSFHIDLFWWPAVNRFLRRKNLSP
jgi:hypothetical protein